MNIFLPNNTKLSHFVTMNNYIPDTANKTVGRARTYRVESLSSFLASSSTSAIIFVVGEVIHLSIRSLFGCVVSDLKLLNESMCCFEASDQPLGKRFRGGLLDFTPSCRSFSPSEIPIVLIPLHWESTF